MKQDIVKSPTKSVYVKMRGKLYSSKPVVAEAEGKAKQNVVLREDVVSYISMAGFGSKPPYSVENVSKADAKIKLTSSPSSSSQSQDVSLSRSCLDYIEKDQFHQTEKAVGHKIVSAVAALVGYPWPHSTVTTVKVVPNDIEVFAIGEAFIDELGDGETISIKPTISWSKTSLFTREIEQPVIDQLENTAFKFNIASSLLAMAGLSAATVAHFRNK